jgi:hypothetical protein
MIDYPTAWRLVKQTAFEEHHIKCSYRTESGALLCDCEILANIEKTLLKEPIIIEIDLTKPYSSKNKPKSFT